ncbi:hypothetical protein UT300009_21240 [Paraclostridium bifermentans]
MILFENEDPRVSIYYLSSIMINILNEYKELKFDVLYKLLEDSVGYTVSIDDVYYSLDWLYLLDLVDVSGDKVILCL